MFFMEEQVAPNKGYAEFGKKTRKTHEEILEKLCGKDSRISPEFFENDTEMEAKWCPKWSQRFQGQ